jgi:SPX domain protein involved in polyphosphate accumulation
MRYERKFAISEMSVREVENFIKHCPAIFSEIFYERTINNIYFDSPDFKNYNENLQGNSQRMKIRIRWYGEMFGLIHKPVLELKIKNNELGTKKSFLLKDFVLDKKISLDFLQEVFLKSNLPNWLIEELKISYPSLLNSYKRKYFISADKKYRITLDWDLIFFRINKGRNLFAEKVSDEASVLEIKYSLKDSDSEAFIGQYFPFRMVAHSKYIKGIDLLDL